VAAVDHPSSVGIGFPLSFPKLAKRFGNAADLRNVTANTTPFAGREFAHVVVGAKTPILIPSRVESARDKVNAMALGVLYAAR